MGNLYVAINNVNGKKYVGQTIHPVAKRIKEHARTDYLLGRAIKKHGIDNFTIIEYLDVRDEWIDWAEQELISHHQCVSPKGYNLHLGGQGNRKVSDETRQKISRAKTGKPSPRKGVKLSAEQIEQIRVAHTGHKWTAEQKANLSKIRQSDLSKYMTMLGRKHSDETKAKMSAAHKNIVHNAEWNKHVAESNKGKHNKKVICIETQEVFESIKEAQEKYNVSNISAACKGKRQTIGGKHWAYYTEEA